MFYFSNMINDLCAFKLKVCAFTLKFLKDMFFFMSLRSTEMFTINF